MKSEQTTAEPLTLFPYHRSELIAVMREQERLCSRLLEMSRREREAMVEGRVEFLESLTRDKSAAIVEMDRLEQRRRTIAADLAREVGAPENISLLGLAARLGGDEAEELLEIRHRVAQAVGKLRETNDGNTQLMRRSLEAVRDSMRQLRNAVGIGNTYTWSGQPRLYAGGALAVDCRA